MQIGNYKLTFSWLGLLAFIIPMIPNIFWAVLPAVENGMQENAAPNPIIDMIMRASQYIMIGFMIALVNQKGMLHSGRTLVLIIGGISLAAYLISWVIYFYGTITPMLLVGMAVFPTVYFICFTLLMRNGPACVMAIIFAACHIAVTAYNYLFLPNL